jgi:hypothetical protein
MILTGVVGDEIQYKSHWKKKITIKILCNLLFIDIYCKEYHKACGQMKIMKELV